MDTSDDEYMSFEQAVFLILDIRRDPLWHFINLLHLGDDAYSVWACALAHTGDDEEFMTPAQWRIAQERERVAYERTVPVHTFRKRSKAS